MSKQIEKLTVPWRVEYEDGLWNIVEARGVTIARGLAKDVADQIVRAVNTFDPMREVCEQLTKLELSFADPEEPDTFSDVCADALAALTLAVPAKEQGK